MRTYAEEENVPIMQRDGINFLVEQIIKKRRKKHFRNRNCYRIFYNNNGIYS